MLNPVSSVGLLVSYNVAQGSVLTNRPHHFVPGRVMFQYFSETEDECETSEKEVVIKASHPLKPTGCPAGPGGGSPLTRAGDSFITSGARSTMS